MAWGGTSSNPVLCTTASGCTVHGMEIGKQVDVGGWSAGDLSGRLGFESYRHV